MSQDIEKRLEDLERRLEEAEDKISTVNRKVEILKSNVVKALETIEQNFQIIRRSYAKKMTHYLDPWNWW